jgi:hypothetical protein
MKALQILTRSNFLFVKSARNFTSCPTTIVARKCLQNKQVLRRNFAQESQRPEPIAPGPPESTGRKTTRAVIIIGGLVLTFYILSEQWEARNTILARQKLEKEKALLEQQRLQQEKAGDKKE